MTKTLFAKLWTYMLRTWNVSSLNKEISGKIHSGSLHVCDPILYIESKTMRQTCLATHLNLIQYAVILQSPLNLTVKILYVVHFVLYICMIKVSHIIRSVVMLMRFLHSVLQVHSEIYYPIRLILTFIALSSEFFSTGLLLRARSKIQPRGPHPFLLTLL